MYQFIPLQRDYLSETSLEKSKYGIYIYICINNSNKTGKVFIVKKGEHKKIIRICRNKANILTSK